MTARRPSGRFADFSEIGVHTSLCLKLVGRRAVWERIQLPGKLPGKRRDGCGDQLEYCSSVCISWATAAVTSSSVFLVRRSPTRPKKIEIRPAAAEYRSSALVLAPYQPAHWSATLNRPPRQFGLGRIPEPPWQRALRPFLICGVSQFSRS